MRFPASGPLLAGLIAFLAVSPSTFAQRALRIATPDSSEQRVALIVGNSAYKESPLQNPVNDAADMAAALRALGFSVTLRTNSTQRQIKQALREFGQALKKGGVGLFYFAGHGVQYRGRNFLIPVGAPIDTEAELEDESVDANLVLSYMEEAQNRVNIVILDACRNNPFARGFRSASRGLAQMEAARGTFVAFATAPGSVASDGAGRNGVYTQHLLTSLKQADTDIDKVFRRVTEGVSRSTGGKQVPWVSTSLTGDFYFRRDAQAPARPAAPAGDAWAMELAFWESIKASSNTADFREYLNTYPNGHFAGLARNRLEPPAQVATVIPSAQGVGEDPARISKPGLRVGDRWVFRSIDLWKGEETGSYDLRVTGVVGDEIALNTTILTSKTGENIGQPSKRTVDAATWSFSRDPRVLAGRVVPFAFPLQVGKTWEYEYKLRSSSGQEVTHKRTAVVEGWEEVVVPAGTFNALKVVHSGTWSYLDFGSLLRGTQTETYWYSPDAKGMVKRELTDWFSGGLRAGSAASGGIWEQVRNELTQLELKK